MIHVELNEVETKTFVSFLESEISDLAYEIANTDLLDYRNALKAKRTVLRKVLVSVTEPAVRV